MKNYYILLIPFLCFSINVFSQNQKDIENITKDYNKTLIKEKQIFYKTKEEQEKKKAIEVAEKNGWPTIVKGENGFYQELIGLTPDGHPLYLSTENRNAAISTRATQLNTGGSLGLNLNGQGMVARVWDGGTVRRTHNILSNSGGIVVTVDDLTGTSYSDHATHVTGTMIGSASSTFTKGMAYEATARTFNWDDDESEALSEVLLGMLVSNHSYGIPMINSTTGALLPDWYIGAYTESARAWDDIMRMSPYYLMVASAGNNGGDFNTGALTNGYDKLTGDKTAKNSLVVANAQDASVNLSTGELTAAVVINSGSSQGPTDDRRIKPDITGNGTTVRSSTASSNTSTDIYSGTSMSSPNVSGTLLLLQQHYKNVSNSFMKAATLKGLATHTADDAGRVGPDANFGWGLLNAKAAAVAINENGLKSWISEEILNNNQTFTMEVQSDGINPLIASITWTDLPGVAQDNTNHPANDPTPVLVNDLDIRVSRAGTTYYPWRLQSVATDLALRDGDNNVDTVENIKIDTPTAGLYTISVTHKNTLQDGPQPFSLIVTGITSAFSLTSTSDDLIVCSSSNATYSFDYKQTGAGTTNFTATGLPTGATATFNNNSLSANGSVTMTISNLSGVMPGVYNVGIVGDNGTETEIRYKKLTIYSPTLTPVTLISPSNNIEDLPSTVTLNWDEDFNIETYRLQVATDALFTNMYMTADLTVQSQTLYNLASNTKYYWRVIPINRCGQGVINDAPVFNFSTGNLNCGITFTATDYSNNFIDTVAGSSASVPVTVTGGHIIGDLNVNLNLTHTWLGDIVVSLEGPASIGSPTIVLFNTNCGEFDDINCTLDDSGSPLVCGTTFPSISGTVKPIGSLSSLNQLSADGVWTLKVDDLNNGDGGTINSFSINICSLTETTLGINSNYFEKVSIYPNPATNFINVNFGGLNFENTTLSLFDIQGRRISKNEASSSNEIINTQNLQNGVYLLVLEKENNKSTFKIVVQ